MRSRFLFVLAACGAMLAGRAIAFDSPVGQPFISGGLIAPDTWYTTSMNTVFTVSRWPDDLTGYRVLVGPTLSGGTVIPARFKFAVGTNPESGKSEAALLLRTGYGYFTGIEPYGGTEGDEGVGEGTIWAMEISDGRVDQAYGTTRYYLLHGTGLILKRVSDGSEVTIASEDHYRSANNQNGLISSTDTPIGGPGDEPYEFVERVTELARQAGLPTPPGWPPD